MQTYTRINGFDMFYRDEGTGIPLLLIHGFPLTGDIWRPQVEALSPKARVIVPDLRGFGRSGVTEGASTMDVFAGDLKSLLDGLGVEKAVIAGISMGGYVAFAFYRLYASSVRALILLDTKPGADSEQGKAGRLELARSARNGEMERIADDWAGKLFDPSMVSTNPDVVREVRGAIYRSSPEGLANASLGMMERPDSTPMLKDIDCPCLIMVGGNDTITTPREAGSMAIGIKGARAEVIKGAGHLTCLEAPEQVNGLMTSFLSGL